MQPQSLQLGPPRPAPPGAGFAQAVEFDVAYRCAACLAGVAKVSVAPAYDTQTMAMTAALASADRWGDTRRGCRRSPAKWRRPTGARSARAA